MDVSNISNQTIIDLLQSKTTTVTDVQAILNGELGNARQDVLFRDAYNLTTHEVKDNTETIHNHTYPVRDRLELKWLDDVKIQGLLAIRQKITLEQDFDRLANAVVDLDNNIFESNFAILWLSENDMINKIFRLDYDVSAWNLQIRDDNNLKMLLSLESWIFAKSLTLSKTHFDLLAWTQTMNDHSNFEWWVVLLSESNNRFEQLHAHIQRLQKWYMLRYLLQFLWAYPELFEKLGSLSQKNFKGFMQHLSDTGDLELDDFMEILSKLDQKSLWTLITKLAQSDRSWEWYWAIIVSNRSSELIDEIIKWDINKLEFPNTNLEVQWYRKVS